MKKILLLISMMIMALSTQTQAIEGFDMGVSLMGTRGEIEGEFDVDGVLFVLYEGYEIGINDNSALNLIATGYETSVDGKKVKVYTDLATWQYYGENDFQAMITAVSLDRKTMNNIAERTNEKLAYIEATATKFFALDTIILDASLAVSLGGKTKNEESIKGVVAKFEDDHFYTVEALAGVSYEIDSEIDIYLYAGASYQKGDKSTRTDLFIGAESNAGSFKVGGKKFFVQPYFEYTYRKSNYVDFEEGSFDPLQNVFNTPVTGSSAEAGIRIRF